MELVGLDRPASYTLKTRDIEMFDSLIVSEYFNCGNSGHMMKQFDKLINFLRAASIYI